MQKVSRSSWRMRSRVVAADKAVLDASYTFVWKVISGMTAMLDVQQAMAVPAVKQRADYQAPDWLVPDVALDFDLDAATTRVTATLSVNRNGAHDRPLRLDGDGLEPLSVTVDGVAVNDWTLDDGALVIPLTGGAHTIETQVRIAPDRNTQLMGLYASGGNLCTQCEAEGFRRITFFPDRPDVLSKYRVRMTAAKARYPGAAGERRSDRERRRRTTASIGRNGTIPSPSPAICSRWLPAT